MGRRYRYMKETGLLIFVVLLLFKLIVNNGSGNNVKKNEALELAEVVKSDPIKLVVNKSADSESATVGLVRANEKSHYASLFVTTDSLLYKSPIDIAMIFTNAGSNSVLQYHLRRAVTTLLLSASVPVRLHLISDEESFPVGSKIINEIQEKYQLASRHLKLVFVSAKDLSVEVEPVVMVLQGFFTNQKHSYYRDFLFFFSLFLDRLLPGLNNIILMDIDIKVKGDVAELYSHFSKFSESQVVGLGPELSPVYRHILSVYKNKHSDTLLGSPYKSGGFPGYNSGVVLIKIPKLKDSSILKLYLTRSKLTERTQHYSFQGHLGDQDLYTLIAFDHPEIFYTLPCTWNRQLCQWWRSRGYENVFDEYFQCPGDAKILHGNCKTHIPDDS